MSLDSGAECNPDTESDAEEEDDENDVLECEGNGEDDAIDCDRRMNGKNQKRSEDEREEPETEFGGRSNSRSKTSSARPRVA
jgi:hypothetical protein